MRRVLCLLLMLCGCATTPTKLPTAEAACALPGEPEVLVRDGDAQMLVWETTLPAVWSRETRPKSAAVDTYLAAIQDAGGAARRPVADPPEMPDERMREVWRREFLNEDVAYSGEAGEVRPARCFESMFFAFQAERHSQLTDPTEFIVVLVGKPEDDGMRVRAYFGAGAKMYPPKSVYPFDRAGEDVAKGWRMITMLHNHTVRTLKGKPALGVPAPSTNDVQLARAMAERHGLESIMVTNGLYTIEIPASAFGRYQVPVP